MSPEYYHSKVKHLKSSKPKQWWSEVKRICGHTPLSEIDSSSLLNTVVGMNHLSPNEMAKLINDAFLEPQRSYDPLFTSNKIEIDHQLKNIDSKLNPKLPAETFSFVVFLYSVTLAIYKIVEKYREIITVSSSSFG